MKNIILFDSEVRNHLLPLTYTRPVAALRCGILTIAEKWQLWLNGSTSFLTQPYLSTKFKTNIEAINYCIDGSLLPDAALVEAILTLETNQVLEVNQQKVVYCLDKPNTLKWLNNNLTDSDYQLKSISQDCTFIKRTWDLFLQNKLALISDFKLLTQGRTSQPISSTNTVIGNPDNIFLEEGAVVECSILNVKNAPIYIGKNAEIMEGCMVRDGLVLCEGAQLKMGAKIYGTTTLGPNCKGGGEIGNSILLANSNKGHDGYLGNSVIGEWCNLGADTNTSNLKNTYESVKLWSYVDKRFVQTGQQFLGLIMGDHSKVGINTMFNTGTVVGVASNIFGAGFPRNFIPSFAWGGHEGFVTHRMVQAVKTADIVMKRRNIQFFEEDNAILQHIFDETIEERTWEKNE